MPLPFEYSIHFDCEEIKEYAKLILELKLHRFSGGSVFRLRGIIANDHKFITANSLCVCRYEQNIIGWCLSFVDKTNYLNYIHVYVAKEYRLRGHGSFMIARTLEGLPHLTFRFHNPSAPEFWSKVSDDRLVDQYSKTV